MDSDDAADLLGDLPEDRQEELLREMDAETADDLRELVAYDEDTAGGLMTTDYFWIYPHRTVAATIAKIRQIAPETEFIYYLYVTDQSEKLLGTLSLRTLLLSAPDATIHTIMDTDLITVRPDTSAEDVTATIARYDLLACPVTDEHGKMLGIVTVDDAIDAIIPERLTKQLPRFTKRAQRRRAEAAGLRRADAPQLANPARLLRRARPGLRHGVGRQRRRRHRDVLGGRRALRLRDALDARRADRLADRRAGDGRPHGRGDRPGSRGPDPRELRAAHDVPGNGRALLHQHRDHRDRVRRDRRGVRDLRRLALHRGSAGDRDRLRCSCCGCRTRSSSASSSCSR